jgi:hypothetical protein
MRRGDPLAYAPGSRQKLYDDLSRLTSQGPETRWMIIDENFRCEIA